MPDTKKNALAELANDLYWLSDIVTLNGHGEYLDCVRKAERIIAELAKVGDEDDYSKSPYDYKRVCREAYEECRAIAEKGENNGKQG